MTHCPFFHSRKETYRNVLFHYYESKTNYLYLVYRMILKKSMDEERLNLGRKDRKTITATIRN